MSREVITRERVQKFARRARHYIAGYHVLHQMQQGIIHSQDNQELQDSSRTLTIVPAKLEQMVKKFKTHRCAMDFDHSFCKAVYKET